MPAFFPRCNPIRTHRTVLLYIHFWYKNMRLDKFIANNSAYSRTDVKRLLANKAITKNGVLIKSAATAVALDDVINVHDEQIEAILPLYIMLNKPINYVCANKDNLHSVVVDLITEANALRLETEAVDTAIKCPASYRTKALQIAGRLDVDTTGLVLLTDNGDWNHRITSPKMDCFKRYRVTLEQEITEDAVQQLTNGVMLHGETKPTKPAAVKVLASHEIVLSIQEGKFHQVKRMLHKVGNEVKSLHREAMGQIELDPALKAGKWRHLTKEEIEAIA